MADPFREMYRLEQFDIAFEGMESFTLVERVKDFVGYYFSRFITNIKDSFKDFSKSELEIFNKRYHRQIELTLTDPLLVIDDIRVSIPKGMLFSYYQTLEKLISCLENIRADKLYTDLEELSHLVYSGSTHKTDIAFYTKTMFESDKKTIGSLYNPTSLSYNVGKSALVTLSEAKHVNDILLSASQEYYPQVIKMSGLIDKIEQTHKQSFVEIQPSSFLRNTLMSMAYRVSIFAVIMDHVQTMEHAFVTTLSTLKEHSSRH